MRTDVGKRPLDQRLLGPGKNLARHRTSLRLTAALAVLLLTTAGAAALSAARPASAATSLKSLAEAKGRYFGSDRDLAAAHRGTRSPPPHHRGRGCLVSR